MHTFIPPSSNISSGRVEGQSAHTDSGLNQQTERCVSRPHGIGGHNAEPRPTARAGFIGQDSQPPTIRAGETSSPTSGISGQSPTRRTDQAIPQPLDLVLQTASDNPQAGFSETALDAVRSPTVYHEDVRIVDAGETDDGLSQTDDGNLGRIPDTAVILDAAPPQGDNYTERESLPGSHGRFAQAKANIQDLDPESFATQAKAAREQACTIRTFSGRRRKVLESLGLLGPGAITSPTTEIVLYNLLLGRGFPDVAKSISRAETAYNRLHQGESYALPYSEWISRMSLQGGIAAQMAEVLNTSVNSVRSDLQSISTPPTVPDTQTQPMLDSAIKDVIQTLGPDFFARSDAYTRRNRLYQLFEERGIPIDRIPPLLITGSRPERILTARNPNVSVHDQLLELAGQGLDAEHIAETTGIGIQAVYKLATNYGVKLPTKPSLESHLSHFPKLAEAVQKIITSKDMSVDTSGWSKFEAAKFLFDNGYTQQEIGKILHISRERARQLIVTAKGQQSEKSQLNPQNSRPAVSATTVTVTEQILAPKPRASSPIQRMIDALTPEQMEAAAQELMARKDFLTAGTMSRYRMVFDILGLPPPLGTSDTWFKARKLIEHGFPEHAVHITQAEINFRERFPEEARDMPFAQWLKKKWWEEGVSQKDLADMLGITYNLCGQRLKFMVPEFNRPTGISKGNGERHMITKAEKAYRRIYGISDTTPDFSIWLREQWVTEHRSMNELMAELGVTYTTLSRTLEMYVPEYRPYLARSISGSSQLQNEPASITLADASETHGQERLPLIERKYRNRFPDNTQTFEQWLRTEYLEKARRVDGIGKDLGIGRQQVYKYLRNYGIRSRRISVQE
jgi:DNA-binding CsgD family transcriptional regulator